MEMHPYATVRIILLVGNKSDLTAKRQVSFQQGKELADMLGMDHVETTSAKTSENVEQAFRTMTLQIKAQMRMVESKQTLKLEAHPIGRCNLSCCVWLITWINHIE